MPNLFPQLRYYFTIFAYDLIYKLIDLFILPVQPAHCIRGRFILSPPLSSGGKGTESTSKNIRIVNELTLT